jgi:acetylornithine/N-succinyldiaminopimelate aminotransferase
MLVGLKLKPNNREFLMKGWEQHILLSGCGDNCVRILPPLILTEAEADEIVRRVEATCAAMRVQLAAVA